eukprot:Polyplicarium_translucidae@DN323_c0_g1_i1.p1
MCQHPVYGMIPLQMPEDRYSKTAFASAGPCNNILLKVDRFSTGRVRIRVMGKITQSAHFDALPDFAFAPPLCESSTRRGFDIDHELDDSVVEATFLPPATFTPRINVQGLFVCLG